MEIYSMVVVDLHRGWCHLSQTCDVLIHAANQATHDNIVRQGLLKFSDAGLTPKEKCEFFKEAIKFLGHIVDVNGIRPDSEKIAAISNHQPPSTITELHRFLGMTNQLANFMPDLAPINAPLRQLLRKDQSWIWDEAQATAFQKNKNLLASPSVLAHSSLQRGTIVAADASATSIGAVFLQVQDNVTKRPLSFISRSLNEAEHNYTVIEKGSVCSHLGRRKVPGLHLWT